MLNKTLFRLILSVFILITFGGGLAMAGAKESAAAQAFGQLPTIQEINLSPDGKKASTIRNIKGQINIVTQSLEPGHENEVYFLNFDEGKINSIAWLNNNRILLSLKYQSKRKKSTYYRYRYIAIDWDKKNPLNMVKGKYQVDPNSASLVSTLPNDPDHLLLRLRTNSATGSTKFTYDIFKVNINTAERKRILTGPTKTSGGLSGTRLVDSKGVVRMVAGYRHSKYYYSYRKNEDDKFRIIYESKEKTQRKKTRDAQINEVFTVAGYPEDTNYIYVLSNHENGKTALYEYNINDRSMRPTEIRNDRSGISSIFIDGKTDKIIAYSYTNEKPVTVYLNKVLAGIRKDLSQFFPNEYITFQSYTDDKAKIVFSVTSPTRPGEFYLLDRKLSRITKFADNYPLVQKATLSKMIITSYENRDGMNIPAYLSLPAGKEDAKNLPTIIMPHGGPHARDVWGFDSWVQFLTTRGYAVLQMNFRGSTGYGADYYFKGDYEYGRGMLDDINDGAKWMIAQGYADPKRMCIMGASYGGYAALQAVVRDQSLYKCSVAMAPVADLTRLKRDEWYLYPFDYFIDDDQSFSDISPYHNTDKINLPILMAHGTKDNVVPIIHSERMAKKLKKEGKDVRFIILDKGDHHLSIQENRITFFQEVEVFLEKHLN